MEHLSKTAKEEIIDQSRPLCCRLAFLSALIHTAGSITFSKSGMSLIIKGRGFLKEAAAGIKEVFDVTGDEKDNRLIYSGDYLVGMLLQLDILTLRDGLKLTEGISKALTAGDCCKRAYLAGAFLGGGALSVAGGYHLGFSCSSLVFCEGIKRLLFGFEINAGINGRKGVYTAYVKAKESVCDALGYMGAQRAMLNLSSLMARRDVKRAAARRLNCDVANADKLVEASLIRCEAILKLKNIVDERLQETAQARIKNPEMSYGELAHLLNVSKSTVRYRLNKIVELSKENEKGEIE